MSVLQRQMFIGFAMSMLILIVFGASFIFVFPLDNWSLLWETTVIDLPFLLFVICTSIIFGLLFGFISGSYVNKKIQTISDMLETVEQGKKIDVEPAKLNRVEHEVFIQIEKIQEHLVEQTKLSQKITNDRVMDQQKQIEKIVSEERNRLARELHDSVSQQLFAASMLMSAIMESTENKNSKQLKVVEKMINQSQLEMRALLLHLRPVALKGKTLQEGIKELLNELRQKVPMHIKSKVEQIEINKGIEDHLFRVLQEAVSNTLRHAKATEFEVLLIERDGVIILRIVDDGVGFDVEQVKAGSYGMQNMYERAIEIGGTLKVVSVPDSGTKLEVRVPKID